MSTKRRVLGVRGVVALAIMAPAAWAGSVQLKCAPPSAAPNSTVAKYFLTVDPAAKSVTMTNLGLTITETTLTDSELRWAAGPSGVGLHDFVLNRSTGQLVESWKESAGNNLYAIHNDVYFCTKLNDASKLF